MFIYIYIYKLYTYVFFFLIYDRNSNLNSHTRIFWKFLGSNSYPHRGVGDYHWAEYPSGDIYICWLNFHAHIRYIYTVKNIFYSTTFLTYKINKDTGSKIHLLLNKHCFCPLNLMPHSFLFFFSFFFFWEGEERKDSWKTIKIIKIQPEKFSSRNTSSGKA